MDRAGRGPAPASERLRRTLDRIERHDARVGAFVEVRADPARDEVAALDAAAADDLPVGPLHGTPVAIKELFDVAGADQSYGSLVRAGLIADRDALLVERLRRAGATIVGTTRSHEFGWGITTQHAERGSTRNPWDLRRVPGGSSGGSAAAVAAGFVEVAVGTDTGGSIRIPAAFCGVLGLKTTFGRIPRLGAVALAPSFDSPGFLARTTTLLAAALHATAAPTADDPSTATTPPLGPLDGRLPSPLTFATPEALAPAATTPARDGALASIVSGLLDAGGTHVDAQTPDAREMLELFVPIQLAEALDTHTRVLGTYPAHADRYGADVRDRLGRASTVTIGGYLSARAGAERASARLHAVLERVDVLLSVVGSCGPSLTASPDTGEVDGVSVPLREAIMPSTVPQNLAGLPSITVPAGVDELGLPIGVQITGRRWSEPMLLAVAGALERAGVFTVTVAPGFDDD